MKSHIVAAALLLLPTTAFAEPLKLNVDQAFNLYTALAGLDGYDKVVKDGQQEHAVKTFYELGGGLRLSIARDMTRLREVVTTYQAARQNALLAAGNKADQPKYMADDSKMRSEMQNIDLDTLKSDELHLDKNPIPASVLSMLSPILKD